MQSTKIFLSAGEPSGDLHGSNLIRHLLSQDPRINFVGFGGSRMADAGCALDKDMSDLAIMGFGRVVPYLREFWKLYRHAQHQFRTQPPDAVVLIDYPGFNWWVARAAKEHGIPVFYFGTPQIWGWATHRVRKLRRLVDHSLCKLPFEPAWYEQHGCHATFVGHPYFDDFVSRKFDAEFVKQFEDRKLVTILPGSRKLEVTQNLPAFLRTIDKIQAEVPGAEFAIASYNDQQAQMARRFIMEQNGVVRPGVYVDKTRELIRSATLCLACSGSVSLELLHELKPTIIHYKIDHFGNFLQKNFRRCKFITLVNLLRSENRFEYRQAYDPDDISLLEEAPFPEYLTIGDKSTPMARHAIRWLNDEEARQSVVRTLLPMKHDFAKPGASKAAAEYILRHLNADQLERSAGLGKVA